MTSSLLFMKEFAAAVAADVFVLFPFRPVEAAAVATLSLFSLAVLVAMATPLLAL